MRRLANAFPPSIIAIGLLVTACTGTGQAAPSGSPTASPTASVAALARPTPTAQPSASARLRPQLSATDLPKKGQGGVPPGIAAFAFKEVGLPGGLVVTYEVTGDGSASYQCWNPTTKAFGKQNWTVTHGVAATAHLTAGADGTIESVLQVRLPEPGKIDCSMGFQAVAYAGQVEHPRLTDTTNAVTVALQPYQFTAD